MRTLSPASVKLASRQFDGPQPATVLRVTNGDLYVELKAAPGLEIGPCAWSRPLAAHSHGDPDGATGTYAPPDPPSGTACLIQFVGSGVSAPWVTAWDGWPA